MSIRDEIAAELDGSKYPLRISKELQDRAKLDGIVIVYGASYDLMEFEGAINDEVGAYDGHVAHLTKEGLLENECENDDCPHFERIKKTTATIEAIWGGDFADGFCDCAAIHTIDEIDSGQCDCCGKPISPEEYS